VVCQPSVRAAVRGQRVIDHSGRRTDLCWQLLLVNSSAGGPQAGAVLARNRIHLPGFVAPHQVAEICPQDAAIDRSGLARREAA
jgi:hypothetical protein